MLCARVFAIFNERCGMAEDVALKGASDKSVGLGGVRFALDVGAEVAQVVVDWR